MPTIQLDDAAVRVPLPGRGEREILAPTTLTLTEHRIGIVPGSAFPGTEYPPAGTFVEDLGTCS